ncbi:MAG: hypothetical protein PHH00_03230 [Candidatus Nanoarchaeia archaeon]|nr:hypothetical protein [Candidatus Nanoarchaeia archaeon]
MDFLFHEVSEKEKEEIRKQAKSIIDDFSKKLSHIDKAMKKPIIERKEYERKEGEGKDCDNDFRKIMFENAPDKNDDFIFGEKKKWE